MPVFLTLVIVESSDYRFEFKLNRSSVIFGAVRVDGNDLTADDEQRVIECLKDMGKWEATVKALSDLLTGAGLSNATSNINPSRLNAYETQLDKDRDVTTGRIYLSPEERHRRNEAPLSVEEISGQVENIDKWRNLQRAISSVRSVFVP